MGNKSFKFMIPRSLLRCYRKIRTRKPEAILDVKLKTERHGSEYGGWDILPNSLTSNSSIFSIGIGHDYTFDESLIKKYRCEVIAFDPTPIVIDWMRSQNLPKGFNFHPIALGIEDGSLTFYTPAVEGHVSHTAQPNIGSKAIEVPALTIQSLLDRYAKSQLDILKIDIEGFEYQVIPQILALPNPPKQLLIEFHHFMSGYRNADTEKSIEDIRQAGYDLFCISDSFREYSFVKR